MFCRNVDIFMSMSTLYTRIHVYTSPIAEGFDLEKRPAR
jgi:hypothetical protein